MLCTQASAAVPDVQTQQLESSVQVQELTTEANPRTTYAGIKLAVCICV